MQATHRSRRFGRLMAAWLLLWFLAMSGAPLGAPSGVLNAHSPPSIKGDAKDVADCGHAAHHHHPDHDQAAQPLDPCAAGPEDVHARHAAGSLSHCPLCLHGAAPPPVVLPAFAAADTPVERPAHVTRSVRRPRTDVPPPARGPPALS
jgi:hypothetical protein